MPEKEKKVILDTSNKAATYKTDIKGWVSSDGRFFGEDERTARFAGSTHRICDDCQEQMEQKSYCRTCSRKKEAEEYKNYEFEEWDGEAVLAIHGSDIWFFSEEDIEDYLSDNELKPKDLMLVICEPMYLSQMDPWDQWVDELPEDGDLPAEILAKVKELNELIKKQEPVSWWHGNKRTEYKP